MYNVKILNYGNELQLNWYDYGISTKEVKEKKKNESNKRSSTTSKQPDLLSQQCDTSTSESDNKVRSTRRTKQSIYNISRSNNWEWFATFTFKENRYDYDICKKNLQTFLNNTKKRKCELMEYLCVPEQHKDGAYHFHALISGITDDVLCPSWEKGRMMFNNYHYGISQCERVKDTQKVSMYITKYITKDLVNDVKGRQRYLCSNGVKRADEKTLYVTDTSLLEFYENNLSHYEITYQKRANKGGYSVNYVQLRLKENN